MDSESISYFSFVLISDLFIFFLIFLMKDRFRKVFLKIICGENYKECEKEDIKNNLKDSFFLILVFVFLFFILPVFNVIFFLIIIFYDDIVNYIVDFIENTNKNNKEKK